ncbi:NPCBM/NEW2 domain-containing protein [Virgibacillus halophilus]|uniref:beta-galactosidase n=1 Tax=Tigheibacillus halophilus TaxID=361280 RepID=A0ABU5C4W1_9BACI|nr:NPCBM/NEW2 domain-containing protein [Virgibacillus halophilus]
MKQDDKVIQQGEIADLDVAPLSTKEITLPIEEPALQAGAEYYVNVSFSLKEDTKWAKKGHDIANEQLKVPYDVPQADPENIGDMPAISTKDDENSIAVKGNDFELQFDKKKGTISSFNFQGTSLLKDGPAPDFWRAPNENDIGNGMPSRTGTWRDAGKNRTVTDVQMKKYGENAVRINVTGTLPTTKKSDYQTSYIIYGTGEVVVKNTLDPAAGLPEIPAVGMQLTLPKEFEQMNWYGRGPEDNYWDRKTGYPVGVYSSTVDDQFFPYAVPQEMGNKTDVRWVTFTNEDGVGLMATGLPLMEVNALHYTKADLEKSAHPYELDRKDDIYVDLNFHQMGLGGDDSWGARPHQEYTMNADQSYSYSYRLQPITKQDKAMDVSKHVVTDDLVKDITIDGKSLDGFAPGKTDYSLSYLKGTVDGVPKVEVTPISKDVKVTVTPAEKLPGKTVIEVTSADGMLSAAYEIQFNLVDELFVSDLPWKSATAGWGSIHRDASIEGNKITLASEDGEKTYDKGIGTHAHSEIVYDIADKGYDKFKAFVGLDREANNTGTVNFQVFVDGEKLFESGVMRRDTPAKKVDVDISGKKGTEAGCHGWRR